MGSLDDYDPLAFEDEHPDWRWPDDIEVTCLTCPTKMTFWRFDDEPPVGTWKCDSCRWADIQLASILEREDWLNTLNATDDPYIWEDIA